MTGRLILTALLVAHGISGAAAHDSGWLPIGDGQITTSPKRGAIFACESRFTGGGAHSGGSWIRDGKWNPELKPSVDGRVSWPDARISITLQGDTRVVSGNGLPTHETGIFPIGRYDDAYAYDRNPGVIREHEVLLRLPAVPEVAAQASCLWLGMIGVAATGAAVYNGLDAKGRDAGAHEILDLCEGHPDPRGVYHYHGRSPCHRADGGPLAYALDGFGIYGMVDEDGRTLTNADLDECHGHVGTVMWNGAPREIYHYHLTAEYPYSVGCFRGTPAALRRGPPDGDQRQPHGGRRGGPLDAVAAELGIDVEVLRRAVGPPPPNIDRASRELGIDRARLREVFEKHRPR